MPAALPGSGSTLSRRAPRKHLERTGVRLRPTPGDATRPGSGR